MKMLPARGGGGGRGHGREVADHSACQPRRNAAEDGSSRRQRRGWPAGSAAACSRAGGWRRPKRCARADRYQHYGQPGTPAAAERARRPDLQGGRIAAFGAGAIACGIKRLEVALRQQAQSDRRIGADPQPRPRSGPGAEACHGSRRRTAAQCDRRHHRSARDRLSLGRYGGPALAPRHRNDGLASNRACSRRAWPRDDVCRRAPRQREARRRKPVDQYREPAAGWSSRSGFVREPDRVERRSERQWKHHAPRLGHRRNRRARESLCRRSQWLQLPV
jgi:hypothetical protein